MNLVVPSHLTLAELEAVLKAADPAVLLVSPRILRRVIKKDAHVPGLGLQVPHRKSYTISAQRLFALVEPQELGASAAQPAMIILLARRSEERLARMSRPAALVHYWRLLFHARVHRALDLRIAEGKLTEADVQTRVERIGVEEFAEIHRVLQQERLLLPPEDNQTAYEEFAAVYLELRHFVPRLVSHYFPGIVSFERINEILAEDVDAASLFTATRLAGAPDPSAGLPAPELPPVIEPCHTEKAAHPPAPAAEMSRQADSAAGLGNVVRAAILRTRAGASADAQADLDKLVMRLQAALHLSDTDADFWRNALRPLLLPASQGTWPMAARLLYDLQKVCIDHERTVYTLDLVEWALSLGKRPIKRPLPGQQEVLALRHLASALDRLSSAGLADADRRQLAMLLQDALHHGEARLRNRFRPLVTKALEEVGLQPRNLPERIARHKLTEELLDRVAERGFLTMGDLRDAISRNQLKLTDLAGPVEFAHGDRLLQANRRLSVALDGVYRPGEVYLRWLQRISSLAFGTRTGRFLTRYVALPFASAYVALEGLQHLTGLLPESITGGEIHLSSLTSVLILGFFLFALLHTPDFRQEVLHALTVAFRASRRVLFDLPVSLLSLPMVRRVLASQPFQLLWRFGLKPLLVTLPLTGLLALTGARTSGLLTGGGAIFLISGVVLNTRLGRDLEEVFTDRLVRLWHWLHRDVLLEVFRWVMEIFRWGMENVERVLYTVDEWLRFRSGDSRLSLVVKTVLSPIWFLVTYVVRFCLNLLIEPQVNPIKHFPVVTVSHKLLLPFIPPLASVLELTMDKALAYTTATFVIGSIPGIFGFLVWELKENWRLYEANRPETLGPVHIGHHGETMLRLLRPGFHSGTIPKLYARLRHAERQALETGSWKSFRKQRDALHHVEEAVRRFVEREFLELLDESKSWGADPLVGGPIILGTNCIRIELRRPDLGPAPLSIAFTEQDGCLTAEVVEAGWLPRLKPEARQALAVALAGKYKLSGVDLVHEHGERIRFSDRPISWRRWVEVWEHEQIGKELPETFPDGVRVLPRQ